VRRASQLIFAGLVLVASVRHMLGAEAAGLASVDALCPFGGVETVWTWITTGRFVSKTHPSNLILGLGLVTGALLAGGAFCGWICPFGAFQDGLHGLQRLLRIKPVTLPQGVDRVLRYGRFVSLAVILCFTITSMKLWFAEYDPYRTLFGLHWLFEPDWAVLWPGLVILAAVSVGALLVERFWCRYLCPAGAVFAVLGHLSLFRIRRNEATCMGCALCDAPCPVGINVAEASPAVSTDCVGCLNCMDACPKQGTLTVQLAPVWLDPFRRDAGGASEEGAR
jgi:polyferredoxin